METIGWIQIIALVATLVALLIEARADKTTEDEPRRKVLRILSAFAICCGIAVVVISEFKSHAEARQREDGLQKQLEAQQKLFSLSADLQQAQKDGLKKADDLKRSQKQVIDTQVEQLKQATTIQKLESRGIHQITNLGLDRYLSALEVSYKPSADQWKKIATVSTVYDSQRPLERSELLLYLPEPVIAQRVADGWSINAVWTKVIENGVEKGQKRFPRIAANQHENKPFADMIQKACLPFLINWGDGTETDIDPWNEDYPSVVTISPSRIALTIHPPALAVYLAALRANPTLSLRGRSDSPQQVRLRSLDASVRFDEVIKTNWLRDESADPHNIKPYISNRHRLHVRFTTLH